MNSQLLARTRYVFVVTLLSILVACARSTVPVSAPSTVTLPATTTITPTTTTKPTVTTTSSPVPPTHIPTATSTPVPTLTAEQTTEFVVEMLNTNGDCELPCWWGIIPGETEFQTVEGIFSSRGIPLLSDSQGGGLSVQIPHPDRRFDYVVDVEFNSRQGMTRSILVRSEIFRGETSKRFARDWSNYVWDKMLTKYGQPSWVSIGFDAPPSEPGAPVTYKMTLLYESLGIAIEYMGPAQYNPIAKAARACPDFSKVTNISLSLVAASQGDSVTKFLLSLSGAPDLGSSLEETTGMNAQTFYATFKTTGSNVCLEEHFTSP